MDVKTAISLYSNTRKEMHCLLSTCKSASLLHFCDSLSRTNQGCIQCEVKGYHSAELTYWMRYDDIHKGYLQSIIKHICAYAFSKFSITTIYAKLSMDNIELSKLYLENGFIESIDTAPIYLYFLHRF